MENYLHSVSINNKYKVAHTAGLPFVCDFYDTLGVYMKLSKNAVSDIQFINFGYYIPSFFDRAIANGTLGDE